MPAAFRRSPRLASLLAAAALVSATATPAPAAPGDLDPTFGSGGVVLLDTSVGTFPAGHDAELIAGIFFQPDGKILTAGWSTHAGTVNGQTIGVPSTIIMRFTADGALDPTFGTGGISRVLEGKNTQSNLHRASLLPDGKILVLYRTSKSVLARLNPDGSLDATFGKRGLAKVTFGKGVPSYAQSFVVLPDGKIMVVGQAGEKSVIARLDGTTGKLDRMFGAGGVVRISLEGFKDATGPQIQTVDGQTRILVHGSLAGAVLVRLLESGALDPSFGEGGVASLPGANGIGGMAFDGEQRMVAAVAYLVGEPVTVVSRVVRFTRDGVLDTSFGDGGLAAFPVEGAAVTGAILEPGTGKILVEGDSRSDGRPRVAIARLNADGTPDGTFGEGGSIVAAYGDQSWTGVGPFAVQTVGARTRLVVGGSAHDTRGTVSFLAAYEL